MIKRPFSGILMALLILLSGCAKPIQAGTAPATEAAPVGATGTVVAEVVVAPRHSVTMVSGISAPITEVLVKEGDPVTSGDVLLRLDATDAENGIQQAEAELAAAQARLALARAGTRQEEIAILKAELEIAEAGLAQAEARRDERAAGLAEADIVDAQANVTSASTELRQAVKAHDETLKCHEFYGSTVCPALGPYEEMARHQMEASHTAMEEAQARLEALQTNATLHMQEAQIGVEGAMARRDAAKARLDLAQAGGRAEQIAAAEAGVCEAEAALEQARAQLDLATVKAPFDGVVTRLPSRVGDIIAADDPLATVATLDRLQIKTVDLTEMDIPRVAVDQSAVVTLDAMLEQPLTGRVARIDQQSVWHYDDVTYPVIIELDETPPDWLRWGMRGQVEIAPDPVGAAKGAGRDRGVVKVDAIVEPGRWSDLQFVVDGRVASVLVAAGAQAGEGDVLAQLRSAEAALAVKEAEAALEATQMELALLLAGPRVQQIDIAEAELAEANAGLRHAAAARDQVANDAEAALAAARKALAAANAEHHQAQMASDAANSGDDKEKKKVAQEWLHTAAAQVIAAQARLEAQPKASAAQLRGSDASVQEAQARVRLAQAQLALVQAGHTSEEIALAEARVQSAKAQLATAEAALARTELRAPFAGTVTRVEIEPGDAVGSGQTVLVLADPTGWRVKTTNLTELDVVNVIVGQQAVIRVDALPEEPFEGVVREIAPQPGDHYGDVTYGVIIDLSEKADPRLRWGMRAVVEIDGR